MTMGKNRSKGETLRQMKEELCGRVGQVSWALHSEGLCEGFCGEKMQGRLWTVPTQTHQSLRWSMSCDSSGLICKR